jgi:hypothetical protein
MVVTFEFDAHDEEGIGLNNCADWQKLGNKLVFIYVWISSRVTSWCVKYYSNTTYC